MSWILIIIFSVAIIAVCVMWVTGIHHMNKNFPDYKADDFLNDKEEKDD
jgi:ATP/ADP translocase